LLFKQRYDLLVQAWRKQFGKKVQHPALTVCGHRCEVSVTFCIREDLET